MTARPCRSVGRAHGARLRERPIELRPICVVSGESPDIADDTHDRHPGSHRRHPDAPADRIGAREVPVGKRAVDDRDRQRALAVAGREVAAGDERDPHRAEEARANLHVNGLKEP